MQKYPAIIIGGGAAGIMAALGSARAGKSAVICEKMPSLGKKILVSGNGRCNLLNDRLSASFYNEQANGLVGEIFSGFGKDRILGLFKEIGLHVYSQGGRIFPVTNQSSSVLRVLRSELDRLSVKIITGFDVKEIRYISAGRCSVVSALGDVIEGRSVVLACGGKSYPALGSDGSGYRLAEMMGHRIVEPVPVCVPVTVKDMLCHSLQGQKICANLRCIINGKEVKSSSGDLLFTKYGLSGTAILDISDIISVAINRHRESDVTLSADIVPFLGLKALTEEITAREHSGSDLTMGILPEKVGHVLKRTMSGESPSRIASRLKDLRFKVYGTRGWNEAEFTSGGVAVNEVVNSTLESRKTKSVFLAGEILDVVGIRGGYNLAWAWASGYVAGMNS